MCFLNRFLIITLLSLEIFFWMPGIEHTSYFYFRLFAAALGLINASIRPLLLISSIKITLLNLAIIALVLNSAAFFIMGRFNFGIHIAIFSGGISAFFILWFASCITNRWIYLETDKF